MGVALWLVCGVATFLVARIVPILRPTQRWQEAVTSIATALIAGFAATALDFGGWNELDWRGGVFALLCAFAAIGLLRFIRSRE